MDPTFFTFLLHIYDFMDTHTNAYVNNNRNKQLVMLLMLRVVGRLSLHCHVMYNKKSITRPF